MSVCYPKAERQVRRVLDRFRQVDEAMLMDAAQAAFTTVVLNPAADLSRPDSPGLLYTALRRRLIDLQRGEERQRGVPLDQPEGAGLAGSLATATPDPADRWAQHEAMAAWTRVVDRLPGPDPALLTALITAEGRPNLAELARRYGLARGTVSNHLHRARVRFRALAGADPQTREALATWTRRVARPRDSDRGDGPER